MAKKKETTPAQAAPPPLPSRDEIGASGTQNYGGYITGEEYNPKLQPPQAFTTYEEMRNDPQVQASLEIVKAPLLSAQWRVQPPAKDTTNEEREVADFCQRVLFERGGMQDTWKYVLEHALLMLDFGVSPLEKVWTLGDDSRYRLKRLAPRLPRTIVRWNNDPATGQLQNMEQQVLKGTTWKDIPIPVDDLAIFVRRREGDNWWGRSVLRTAYKPWFYMTLGEKAESVRMYRYGVGIPMAVRDKDYSPAEGELIKVENTLKGMIAHERSWIMSHTGWTWSILVPAGGSGGDMGTKDVVERHGKLIMRNVLAEFMAGGSDGLNSGRTRTLANVFQSALYATAEDICSVLELYVLRPLCLYNFPGMGTTIRFPTIEPSDVTDVDVRQLADIVARLTGIKVITPDDDLEAFIREVGGLPPMMGESKGKSRERPAPPVFGAPPPPADPNADPNAADPKKGPTDDPKNTPPSDKTPKEARALAARRKDRSHDLGGRLYSRAPTKFELKVFSLADVPDRLDVEVTALAAEITDLRRQQLATLAKQIAKKDARETTGEFTDLRPSEFSVPLKADVERAIKKSLQRVAHFGASQVRLELNRQGSPIALIAPFPEDALVLAGVGASKTAAKSALTTSAKVATETETDAWFNRILETATRIRRSGTQGDALEAEIQLTLLDEIDTGVRPLAKGEINEAFSIGRAAEATKHADEIDEVEYSCLLDANSCDACAEEDGKTFEFGGPEYQRTLPPFTKCEGNKGRSDACRCVHLFHLK